jgi:DNA-directed RNA polymerase subunit beta
VDVKVFTRENGDELNPGVNEVVPAISPRSGKFSVGTKWRAAMETRGVIPASSPARISVFTDGSLLAMC